MIVGVGPGDVEAAGRGEHGRITIGRGQHQQHHGQTIEQLDGAPHGARRRTGHGGPGAIRSFSVSSRTAS